MTGFLWVGYSIALFTAPESLDILGVAVSTWILAAIWLLMLTAAMTVRQRLLYTLQLRALPFSWTLLLLWLPIAWLITETMSWFALLQVISWALVYVGAYAFLRTSRAIRMLYLVWLLTAAILSGLILLHFRSPLPEEIGFLRWDHRTGFGYFLVIPFVVGLVRILTASNWPIGTMIVSSMVTLGLLLSFSRGPWILALVGAITGLMASRHCIRATRTYRVCLAVLIALVVVHVAGVFIPGEEMLVRARSISDPAIGSSTGYRLALYDAMFDGMSKPGGWLGRGRDGAGALIRSSTGWDHPSFYRPGFGADSDFIWLFAEGGFIAVGLMLIGLLAMWRHGIRRVIRPRGEATLSAGSLGSLVLCSGILFLDNVIGTAYGWFLIGTTGVALSRLRETSWRDC